MISTVQAILTIYPNADPTKDFRVEVADGVEQRIYINVAPLTQQQIDTAKATVTDAQYAAAWSAREHPALVAALDDTTNFQAKLLKSLVLSALDALNAHTTYEGAMRAAIAAASSLADLKTRVAAIAPVPQTLTKTNVIDAMTTHINAGDVDS